MAGFPPVAAGEKAKIENAEACRVRHWQRMAQPDPLPKRLSMREYEPPYAPCWIFLMPSGAERARSVPFRRNA